MGMRLMDDAHKADYMIAIDQLWYSDAEQLFCGLVIETILMEMNN